MLLRSALRVLSRRPQIVTEYALRPSFARQPAARRAGITVTRDMCTNAEADEEHAKMHMMFTCGKCDTRALKSFSKKSYETGVVIATCPGCESKHLIADNLGWFGENKNIEQILAKKGIHVPVINENGEYAPLDNQSVRDAGATTEMDIPLRDTVSAKER